MLLSGLEADVGVIIGSRQTNPTTVRRAVSELGCTHGRSGNETQIGLGIGSDSEPDENAIKEVESKPPGSRIRTRQHDPVIATRRHMWRTAHTDHDGVADAALMPRPLLKSRHAIVLTDILDRRASIDHSSS
jgi:hypothetical protein